MADFYGNFVFAKTTASISSTDTTVTVDDVSSLPSNAALSAADCWLVFESNLSHPNSFEIVKLTNVNSSTNTITITRGQDGTTGATHTSGTLVKGVLTAGMLTRLAPARTTSTATTASLVAGASSTSVPITLGKTYKLLAIQTSAAARVRLYTTSAAQTSDLGRAIGTDPTSSAGVVLDYVTTGTSAYSLSPLVDGTSLESTPTASIPMTVTNTGSSSAAITVTLTWIKTEL